MCRKRIVSAVFTVLLLSTLSCEKGGPKLPVEPEFQGRVDGAVVADESTLSGVTVQLTGGQTRSVQTSANGGFSFPGLPAGTYLIEIAGYPEDVQFAATSKSTSLHQGKPAARVDFSGEKKRDGAIAGTVTMEGVGMEGANISISGPEIRSATTDSQGAFAFAQLKRGVYTLTLSGFDPALHSFPVTEQTVQAKNSNVVEAPFAGTLVPQPPEGPTDLAAVPTGSATMTLSWTDASDDETRFEIERREGNQGDWSSMATQDPNAESFEVAGLSPNTAYGFRVRACNDAGCSSFSNEAEAVTEDVPPGAPSGLGAVATGSTTVQLGWVDGSTNEARFEVERRKGSEGSWSPIGTADPNVPSFGDAGLTPATRYVYRVRACNDVGCSAFTADADATTHEIAPEAPSALTATANGPTAVSLTWTRGSDNETGFEIQRREGTTGAFALAGSSDSGTTAFNDTGLTPNTTYGYRVRACNEVDCSAYTDVASVMTSAIAPEAPSALEATPTGPSTMDLSWTDASSDETHFLLERRKGTGGSWAQAGAPGENATLFEDSGLDPSTAYFYRLRACNGANCSAYTEEASATTWGVPPRAPSGLSAVATGTSGVELSWTDRSADETGFRVERKVGSTGSYTKAADVAANTTSFTDGGLSPNTTYSYRVFAFNAWGDSPSSNVETTTTEALSGPNLIISALYINQSTQTLAGDVPLVADKDGLLRVFAVASEANSFQPTVRVRFYLGGSLAHTEVISAPASSVPTSVEESSLGASWNVEVPASLIQPGLSILADVDPTDQVAEGDEGDNSFPVGGAPLAMDVRTSSTFNVTFVPVRQSANDLLGNVTAGNEAQYLDLTMRMLPIAEANLNLHLEYVTNAPALESDNGNNAWTTILSEVNSLRVTEGSSRHYYGVVKTDYNSGVAGMGYLGAPTAIGWDRLPSGSGIAAHEWGHNWNRRHAPGCNPGSADSAYPYADGKIGVWGLDVSVEALKSPSTYYDFMTYCGTTWISDYNYEAIMAYREAYGGYGSPGEPEPSLLVWGRVEGDDIVLEPAFEVTTTPVLPIGSGDYRLDAIDGRGGTILSLAFQPIPVPDAGDGAGHFAFAIPLRSLDRTRIAALRVSGGGHSPTSIQSRTGPELASPPEPEITPRGGSGVEITWDANSFPMALIRDPATGQVLSFARGGRINLSTSSEEIEVIFSDGARSSAPIRRTVR